jgi:hypothetical protein
MQRKQICTPKTEPQIRKPCCRTATGKPCTIDRSDRGSHDQIGPDAALLESNCHPDLD